jgi:putative membrane protein
VAKETDTVSLSDLPTVNACLNTVAAILLALGWVAVRRGRTGLHARFMIAAFVTSVIFLASYITYHYQHPTTPYSGTGWARGAYFAILISHIVLAALVPPLALWTLWLAARKRWESHRRWARWTFPIWIYVSITGVVVYLLLYVVPHGEALPAGAGS